MNNKTSVYFLCFPMFHFHLLKYPSPLCCFLFKRSSWIHSSSLNSALFPIFSFFITLRWLFNVFNVSLTRSWLTIKFPSISLLLSHNYLVESFIEHFAGFFLTLWWQPEWSCKIASMHPSFLLSKSFLRILSLVFSKFWHGARNPYKAVHDRAIFCENIFSKIWANGQK